MKLIIFEKECFETSIINRIPLHLHHYITPQQRPDQSSSALITYVLCIAYYI